MSENLKKPYELSIWKDVWTQIPTNPLKEIGYNIYLDEECNQVREAYVFEADRENWPNLLNLTQEQYNEINRILDEEYSEWIANYDIDNINYNEIATILRNILPISEYPEDALESTIAGTMPQEQYMVLINIMSALASGLNNFEFYIYAAFTDETQTHLWTDNNLSSYTPAYVGICVSTVQPDNEELDIWTRPENILPGDFTWHSLGYSRYEEEKIATIGTECMVAKHRAINPILTKNINGSNTLTFTLYTHYYNEETDNFERNFLLDYITNESKIKLWYGNDRNDKQSEEWYDFIVKNIEENSEDYSYTFTCDDAFINELSKTGFNIQLDETLQNNQGTILELAEKVLEDTDWELEGADSLTQFVTEPLYELKYIGAENSLEALTSYKCMDNNISKDIYVNDIIYVPYSVLNEEKTFFQFIYHDNNNYKIDEDGIIIEEKEDEWYGGYTLLGETKYNINKEEQTVILNDTYYFNNLGISHEYKGKRVARVQYSTYDSTVDRVVNVYTRNSQEYYGYKDIEYISPSFKSNLIVNGNNFTSTKGWGANTNDILELTELPSWMDLIKEKTYREDDVKTYLHLQSSATSYFNSVVKNNFDKTQFIEGDKYVFRIKAYSDTNKTNIISDKIKANICSYIQDDFGKFQEADITYFSFENNFIEDEFTFIPKYFALESDFTYWKEEGNLYYYKEEEKAYIHVENEDNFVITKSYFIKEAGYYYCIAECQRALTQNQFNNEDIGLFINTNISNPDIYIEDIQLFSYTPNKVKYIFNYNTDEEYSEEIEDRPLCPEEYQDAEAKTKYYFYKKPTSDQILSDINFIIKEELDNDFEPVYNKDFSKIKSITVAESNHFNIIQDLSEAFECWAKFNVARDNETGKIVVNDYKKVHPKEFKHGFNYYTKEETADESVASYVLVDKYQLINDNAIFNPNIHYYTNESDLHKFVSISFNDMYYNCNSREDTNIDENNFYIWKNELYKYDKGLYTKIQEGEIYDENEEYFEKDFTHKKRGEYKGKIYEIKTPENIDYYEFLPGHQQKSIYFKEYITIDNYAGFKYGINLDSIQRTRDGESIVSKLIVKNNTNDIANNGFCSIARSEDNPTKQNFLYNFDYYINQGLLDREKVNQDLDNYYTRIADIYTNNQELIDERTEKDIQLISVESQIEFLRQHKNETSLEIQELNLSLKQFDNIGDGYEDIVLSSDPYPDNRLNISDKNVQGYLKTIFTLRQDLNKTILNLDKLTSDYEELNTRIDEINKIIDDHTNQITTLNREFNTKYAHYIQEGSWTSDDYYNDDLYYYDALSVLNTSKTPQVTYKINVIEISQIEGYEPYSFDVGNKTYVEDVEFFGYKTENNIELVPKTPYQEEVIVTEVSYSLDSPEENTITVQNYKTRFEDLFERISATVASLEFNQGAYNRAAALLNEDGTLNEKILQKALEGADFNLLDNSDISIGSDGIIVKNNNDTPALRLSSGGLYTWDGEAWNIALSSDGINSSKLTIGRIDTSEIYIMSNGETSFRWDDKGITAYNFDKQKKTDYNKYVRLDKYGIYGVDKLYGGADWSVNEESNIPIYEQIKRNAFFGLTYGGFFMKSTHGDGYVEISDENDIKVKTYVPNYSTDTSEYVHLNSDDEFEEDTTYYIWNSLTNEYEVAEVNSSNFDELKNSLFVFISNNWSKNINDRFTYSEKTIDRVEIGNLDESNYYLFDINFNSEFNEYRSNLYGLINNKYVCLEDGEFIGKNSIRYFKPITLNINSDIQHKEKIYYKNDNEYLLASTYIPYRIYNSDYTYYIKNNNNYYELDLESYFNTIKNTLYTREVVYGYNEDTLLNEQYYLLGYNEYKINSQSEFEEEKDNLFIYEFEENENLYNEYEKYYLFTYADEYVTSENFEEKKDLILKLTYTSAADSEFDEYLNYYIYDTEENSYQQDSEVTELNFNSKKATLYFIQYIEPGNTYEEDAQYYKKEKEYLEQDYTNEEFNIDNSKKYIRHYKNAVLYNEDLVYYSRYTTNNTYSAAAESQLELWEAEIYYYNYILVGADDVYNKYISYFNNNREKTDVKKLLIDYYDNEGIQVYELDLEYRNNFEYFTRYIINDIYIKESKYGLRLRDINGNTVLQTDDSGQLSLDGQMTVSGALRAHWVDNKERYDLYFDDGGFHLGNALAFVYYKEVSITQDDWGDGSNYYTFNKETRGYDNCAGEIFNPNKIYFEFNENGQLYLSNSALMVDEDDMEEIIGRIENNLLEVKIESRNGIIYKNDNLINTTLIATIYRNGIKTEYEPSMGTLNWYRISDGNEIYESSGTTLNIINVADNKVDYVVKLES